MSERESIAFIAAIVVVYGLAGFVLGFGVLGPWLFRVLS